MENSFNIDLSKRPPWQTFDDLQCKLHALSMYPQRIDSNEINEILTDIAKCISQHVLPDTMYKSIGIMTVHLFLLLSKYYWNSGGKLFNLWFEPASENSNDLSLNFSLCRFCLFSVCNRHDIVTNSLTEQFIKLWRRKQFKLFVCDPATTTDQHPDASHVSTEFDEEKPAANRKNAQNNYIFAMVLSPVYVFAQQSKPRASFQKLANFITLLIKNHLMNFAFLNEQSMKLLHIEWNQVNLQQNFSPRNSSSVQCY